MVTPTGKRLEKESSPHVIPLKVYLGIGCALIVFTAITVGVSSIDLGFLNIVVALGIATLKTSLVAFFFMHLYYDNKFYFFIFATSLFFLTVLIMLTLFDTLRIGDIYAFKDSPITEEAVIYSSAPSESSNTGYSEALLAGKSLYEATCRECHTIIGEKGLRGSFSGLDEEFIYELIDRLEYTRYLMDTFTGTDDERRLLAQYLFNESDKDKTLTTGKEMFDKRCGFCHTKDDDIQPIYDSFYGATFEDIYDIILLLPDQIEMMVPWLGTDDELQLVTEFILSWYDNESDETKGNK